MFVSSRAVFTVASIETLHRATKQAVQICEAGTNDTSTASLYFCKHVFDPKFCSRTSVQVYTSCTAYSQCVCRCAVNVSVLSTLHYNAHIRFPFQPGHWAWAKLWTMDLSESLFDRLASHMPLPPLLLLRNSLHNVSQSLKSTFSAQTVHSTWSDQMALTPSNPVAL